MTQTLIRYALDVTGNNIDNLIQNESHTLSDNRVRAIAPLQGAFYTAGVRVRDKHDDRVLVHGIDYVFAELYQSLTIKYGKEIVGVILVINTTVGSDVAIDYQCVGGDFSRTTESLVDLLKTRSAEDFDTLYWDIQDRPSAFVPSPHLHDLGDIYGFEHLVFALEKVRNAIVWADVIAIDSIMTFVDDFVANLTRLINHRVDTELLDAIIQFKRSFTKNYVDLSNILNFSTASEEEGRQIANPDFVLVSGKEDKYVTIKTLMGFKAVLYNQMVSSGLTNLGKSYGVLALPLKTTILSLPNGAQILLDSLQNIKNSDSPIDNEVYPDLTKQRDRWAIVKVSNNQQDRGGVLLGLNMNTGETYSGLLNVLPNGSSITWKCYLTDNNTQGFLNALIEHMEDPGDPHKTKKHHVGLGSLENLAIATREDIVCRKPLRKYITYDGLLLFMKAIMTGKTSIDDIAAEDTSPAVIAMYQRIFAPCGPCDTGGEYSNVPIPPPIEPSVRPRGQLLTSYCIGFKRMGRYSDGAGGSYESVINPLSRDCGYNGNDNPPHGTLFEKFCVEFDRYGKYADGNGGFYTKILQVNSVDCGFVIETPAPTPEPVFGTDLDILVFDTSVNELTPVPMAYVTVNGITKVSGEDGKVLFSNLIIGETYTITATKADFNNYTLEYLVEVGLNTLNLGLVKTLQEDELRVVLTWGENPDDLDSHLSFPLSDGGRSKVWYSNKIVANRATLDVDDTTGFGPETTTIFIRNPETGVVIPGIYKFSVHHFSGSSNISNSGAIVRLYLSDGSIQTFTPPSDITGGTNNVWVVFELNVASNGTSTVTAIDSQYNASDDQVT